MNYLKYLASFSLLFLTGCATSVNVHLPTTRFDSPEVLGESGDFELGAMIFGASQIQLISDASSRPPVEGSMNFGESLAVSANGYLGLAERLDIRFNLGLAGESGFELTGLPASVNLKLQVLGDTKANAKKGNFALSVTAGAGVGSSSISGDQMTVFGPGGYPWEAETTTYAYEFGAILGKRLSDKVIMYGASYLAYYDIRVKIHHGLSENATSPARDYNNNFDGKLFSGHWGIIFSPGRVYSLAGEIVYMDEKFHNGSSHGEIFGGIQNRFNW